MFTGIVEKLGTVRQIQSRPGGRELAIFCGDLVDDVRIGDSIAVNGVCLTVTALDGGVARFDVIRETLERTTLGTLRVSETVNLERALAAGHRFDGHFVQGHVDGTGTIRTRRKETGQVWLEVDCPEALTEQMIWKGSIALDGVSLTLTKVEPGSFAVALIPHTLDVTTLGEKTIGDAVNCECDMIGKWVRRCVAPYLPNKNEGLTEADLVRFMSGSPQKETNG